MVIILTNNWYCKPFIIKCSNTPYYWLYKRVNWTTIIKTGKTKLINSNILFFYLSIYILYK